MTAAGLSRRLRSTAIGNRSQGAAWAKVLRVSERNDTPGVVGARAVHVATYTMVHFNSCLPGRHRALESFSTIVSTPSGFAVLAQLGTYAIQEQDVMVMHPALCSPPMGD